MTDYRRKQYIKTKSLRRSNRLRGVEEDDANGLRMSKKKIIAEMTSYRSALVNWLKKDAGFVEESIEDLLDRSLKHDLNLLCKNLSPQLEDEVRERQGFDVPEFMRLLQEFMESQMLSRVDAENQRKVEVERLTTQFNNDMLEMHRRHSSQRVSEEEARAQAVQRFIKGYKTNKNAFAAHARNFESGKEVGPGGGPSLTKASDLSPSLETTKYEERNSKKDIVAASESSSEENTHSFHAPAFEASLFDAVFEKKEVSPAAYSLLEDRTDTRTSSNSTSQEVIVTSTNYVKAVPEISEASLDLVDLLRLSNYAGANFERAPTSTSMSTEDSHETEDVTDHRSLPSGEDVQVKNTEIVAENVNNISPVQVHSVRGKANDGNGNFLSSSGWTSFFVAPKQSKENENGRTPVFNQRSDAQHDPDQFCGSMLNPINEPIDVPAVANKTVHQFHQPTTTSTFSKYATNRKQQNALQSLADLFKSKDTTFDEWNTNLQTRSGSDVPHKDIAKLKNRRGLRKLFSYDCEMSSSSSESDDASDNDNNSDFDDVSDELVSSGSGDDEGVVGDGSDDNESVASNSEPEHSI